MKKIYLLLFLLSSLTLSALSLKNELPLTTETGKLIIQVLAQVKVTDRLTIKRADGFVYKVDITEIFETPELVKIYGKISNVEETYFGVHLIKGGTIAGAVVEKTNGKVYVLEFSQPHEGLIFSFSVKHSKPII